MPKLKSYLKEPISGHLFADLRFFALFGRNGQAIRANIITGSKSPKMQQSFIAGS